MDPYEIVQLEHVVPANVHPDVSHHHVLNAAHHGVRERRGELLTEGYRVHQDGPHDAGEEEVDQEARARPVGILVGGPELSRGCSQHECRHEGDERVVVHQLDVPHVAAQFLLGVEIVGRRGNVVERDVSVAYEIEGQVPVSRNEGADDHENQTEIDLRRLVLIKHVDLTDGDENEGEPSQDREHGQVRFLRSS